MILLDTSGVIAALFPDQPHHQDCARLLLEVEPPRVLSPFVLAEIDYLIGKYGSVDSELQFLSDVAAGAYELAAFDGSDVTVASEIVDRYRDLELGLADASIIVLAHRYQTTDILTLDHRHFRALRPLTGKRRFRLLPADR